MSEISIDSCPLVPRAQLEKAVRVLKCFVAKRAEEATKQKLLSIDDDAEIVQLQFSFKQIPKMDRKNINVVLPHPLVTPTTTVCLFVRDLDKGRDYSKSVRKYREIFASRGVSSQIEIFPLKRLKLEFGDFEAKRNLSNSYDVYLADARITRLLPAYLGKHFIGRSRYPLQVRLDARDLVREIQRALHTSQCALTGKGSTCAMSVGRLSQADADLVDNVAACVDKLVEGVPGGPTNIRNLVIRTKDSKALPIYLSLGRKDEVALPKRRYARAEATPPEDVTTVLGAKVSVSSRGVVKVIAAGGGGASKRRKMAKK